MQKINVFAQYPKGGSYYKSKVCHGSTTINEILEQCNLSTVGASVYLNGTRLAKIDWDKPVSHFKLTQFAFLSLRYGESDQKPKLKPKTSCLGD